MARIDDPTIYNPFGWRLADLADPATSPQRRDTLLEELLVWEAEEAAHGYRHLTVVHGDPLEVGASRHLSGFYDTLRDLADRGGWARVRGTFTYVTVTVRGDDADERIDEFAAAAGSANPGTWTVTPAAFPPIT